ncbi:MAG: DUF3859 domain-containing protein [Leptolyngbyaceae cyanobacterium bins.302]|nr:DUF3859 domain-containing protein [Leptolyngbyaceae cyanobacterium bins.302]
MNDRLSHAQLQKLVAEVERLQNRQQDELEPEQVREILQELNLSPELLPDAMIQLQRREALEVQQRRRRWIWGGAIAATLLLVGGGLFLIPQQQQALDRVTVQSDQITLQQDASRPVTTVSRPSELLYQVTLDQAPFGKTLNLRCDWLNPNGVVVQQNQYETKPITTSVWQTRCRHQLDATAPTGTWTVQLFQGDRRLSEQTFEVR